MVDNTRIFGFEIQHIFPTAILTENTPEAMAARALLADIGFNTESRGNKIGELITPETAAAILNGSQAAQQALLDAGFGLNWHDSRTMAGHPGYNQFIIQSLSDIATQAKMSGWDVQAEKLAVFDLFSYISKINKDGSIPIDSPATAFEPGWMAWSGGKDYAALTPEQTAPIETVINSFITTTESNTNVRSEVISNLISKSASVLNSQQLAEANDLFNQGLIKETAISLIHDLQLPSSTPVNSIRSVAEYLSALLVGKLNTLDINAIADDLTSAFNTISKYASDFAANFEAYGKAAFDDAIRSLNFSLKAVGINEIANAVVFLDQAYDSIKKGFQTGDWSDFANNVVTFGVGAVVGAVLIAGSVAVAAGIAGAISAAAAAPVAALVAAGWGAYGLFVAIESGADLLGKITADINTGLKALDNFVLTLEHTAEVGLTIFSRAIALADNVSTDSPVFSGSVNGGSLVTRYLVDPLNDGLPSEIMGTTANEQFFGQNNASIAGGGGNDEFYVTGESTVIGGSGNDVLVGANAKFIPAGSPIDPNDPSQGVAKTDLQMTLDGGPGNDWVVEVGGDKAITVGGLGRDFIYNGSVGGILWGDVENSILDVATDTRYYLQPAVDANGNPIPGAAPQKIYIADNSSNADNFSWSPNTTIEDPQYSDIITFFGLPLVGGTDNGGVGLSLAAFGLVGDAIAAAQIFQLPINTVYVDQFLPFITYKFVEETSGANAGSYDLVIGNVLTAFLDATEAVIGGDASSLDAGLQKYAGVQVVKDFVPVIADGRPPGSYTGAGQFTAEGKLGLVFKKTNPIQIILDLLPPDFITLALEGGGPIVDEALTAAAAAIRFAKALSWYTTTDPLVLDLSGDGLATTSLDGSTVHFDFNNNLFAERTAWLTGDEGFLVIDKNHDGIINSTSEMFGATTGTGFMDLAAYDANHDGVIDVNDPIFSQLEVWIDSNGNGVSDPGELFTLGQLGITSISLNSVDLGDGSTANGTTLSAASSFTYSDGTTGQIYDATFPTDPTDTVYQGESGAPVWANGSLIDAKGFGTVTNLAIATANDFDLAALVAAVAPQMTTPDLTTLVQQAAPIFGLWGETLNQTRELVPVLLGKDANGNTVLVDRAVYVEDAQGGYWTLQSGGPVLDASGDVIARPTMQQVLAQTVAPGEDWQLQQMWSPATRATPLQFRADAPYLCQIVNGRAVIVDYGIQNADGSWSLASGNPVLDANNNVIAAPTLADVLAQVPSAGDQWRAENIGYNPFAAIPVQNVALDVVNGVVVDYTVQLTDQDGTFYVWARNLDRALQLQAKDGNARAFDLRNYAVDFSSLQQQVDATDDSTYRIELMTPAELNFALELDSVPFQPQFLSGTIDSATGVIDYTINDQGQTSLSDTGYVSGIQQTIGLLNSLFQEYVTVSRADAVAIALQGGLSQFAQGISYDATTGQYSPTTKQQLAPMLEAVFDGAPADNTNNAIAIYLENWDAVLWQVFPNFQISAGETVSGDAVSFDQVFLLQQLIEAYENSTINYDIYGIANALSVDQSKIITTSATGVEVDGTSGTDYFYITTGNDTFDGGGGSEYYFVGKNAGSDTIVNYDVGKPGELIFTSLDPEDVYATREGEDLLLTVLSTGAVIRVTDEFLGELNPYYTDGSQRSSGVDTFLFADGTTWDRSQLAFEVSHRENGDISLIGSGSADVLWAGVGSQYLSGGAGGDTYIVEPGDGNTTIDDEGDIAFGPIQTAINILDFRGGLTASNLRLTRQGDSNDLLITELDDNGNPTGDTVLIKNEFYAIVYNLGAFASILGSNSSDTSLDYATPDQISEFIFDDGTSLDFEQIVQQVIANNETPGDDVIYGTATNDTIDGGTGNDYESGGSGSDTYIFRRGYGQDIVEPDDETSILFGDEYTKVLNFADTLWSDLTFIRLDNSQDLTFQITGSDSEVTIPDFTKTDPLGLTEPNRINEFVFSDGTTWGIQETLQHFIDVYTAMGNDTVAGFSGFAEGTGFTFTAGPNELLEGQSGDDTYIFGRGDGNDTIYDQDGNDTLILRGLASTDVTFSRTTLNLIITINNTGESVTLEDQYVRANEQGNAIENFQFTDTTLSFTQFNPDRFPLVTTYANETLEGSDFAETLDGRGGDATLIGHSGDTFLFDIGYGNETIIEERAQAAWDDRPGVVIPVDASVQFGEAINRQNVIFTKEGNDLVISFVGYSDTIRIVNQFLNLDDQVRYFKFYDNSDGTPDYLTANDVAELLQIVPSTRSNTIVVGQPDQPNVFDAPGNDTLVGGTAADTYAFSSGYGFETIEEAPHAADVIDKVVFGATVNPDVIKLSRDGTDLVIDLGNGTDVLTIQDGLGTHGVDQYLFANGTVWTLNDIENKLLIGTSGDDQIFGFDGRTETIDGGTGSDYLAGGTGDDTYVFGFGYGPDAIYDTGGNNTLLFKSGVTEDKVNFSIDGDNLIVKLTTGESVVILGGVGATPVQNFVFDNGNGPTLTLDQVRARILAAQDVIGNQFIDLNAPDAGSTFSVVGGDQISVSQGSVVTFNAGDGSAQITVPGPSVSAYTVSFPDLASGDVTVRAVDANSGDVELDFPSGDRLDLPGVTNDATTVTLQFADGVTWSNARIGAALISAEVAADAPFILGTAGNDTIDAGIGTHEIIGNGGNDTFLFHAGDGSQTISDSSDVNNVLEITGYTASDVTISKLAPDQNILVLTFAGSTDQITLNYDANRDGVTQIVFDDGTTLSQAQLFSTAIGTGTSQDGLLVGTSGDEVFDGGAGNHTIVGGGGDDVYIFNRGDGRDTITSKSAADGKGIVQFGAGITQSDIVATRDASGDIILSIAGTNDSVTLVTPTAGWNSVVAGVTFADGTSLSYDDIAQSIPVSNDGGRIVIPSGAGTSLSGVEITGGNGNDFIQGGNGDDILIGGKGNDTLSGGPGSDTYFFAIGDGQDTIVDNGNGPSNETNRLVFGAGITPGDVSFVDPNGKDLVALIGAGSDRVTIQDMLDNPADEIEQFVFANGTTLSASDAIAATHPAVPSIEGTPVADAARDFSLFGNPNGAWSYGEGVGGSTFTPFTVTGATAGSFQYWQSSTPTSGVPLIGENFAPTAITYSTVVVPGHSLIMHPGAADDAIMRWTASTAGDYNYAGSFALADTNPSGVMGEVFDNGTEIYSGVLSGAGASFPYTGQTEIFQGNVYLNVGDTLSFVVNNDGSYFNDSTAVNARISFVTTGGVLPNLAPVGLVLEEAAGPTAVVVPVDYLTIAHDAAAGTIAGTLDGIDPNLGDTLSYSIVDANGNAVADPIFEIVNGNQLAVKAGAIYDDASVTFHTLNILVTDAGGAAYETPVTVEYDVPAVPATDVTTVPQTILGTTGDDQIVGSNGNSYLSGGYGDDTIQGGGDPSLNWGNDTFDGGPGDDVLYGGRGDDTYIFDRGDGDDTIYEAGGDNTIDFGAGIAMSDITVSQVNGTDIRLTLDNGDGSITIKNVLGGDPDTAIQHFVFADGSWTWADVVALSQQGGDGDNVLQAVMLPVGDPAVNLIYNGGFENFTPGTYVPLAAQNLPGWVDANGNQIYLGDNSNGWFGSDDGAYSLYLNNYGVASDISQQIADLTAGQALLLQFDHAGYYGSFDVFWNGQLIETVTDDRPASATDDLFVTARDGVNTLRFLDIPQGYGAAQEAVDNVQLYSFGSAAPVYGDGSAVQNGDILAHPGASQTGVLYDAVEASAAAAAPNLIVNGTFQTPDPLSDGSVSTSNVPGWTDANGTPFQIESDTTVPAQDAQYLYVDDGSTDMDISQTISDLSSGQELLLRFDLAAQYDTTGAFDVYWNGVLTATIDATDQSFTTDSYLVQAQDGDNVLRFASIDAAPDGSFFQFVALTNISLQAIDPGNIAAVPALSSDTSTPAGPLSAGDGDDTLIGSAGDDTLIAGTGDDLLEGGAGDDTYQFNPGDGQDTIVDTQGYNRLVFGEGIAASDVRMLKNGTTVALAIADTGEQVTIGTPPDPGDAPALSIQEVDFADGTVWTADTLAAMERNGSDGSGIVQGDNAGDFLSAGPNDVTVLGGGGDDTLTAGPGNDLLEGGLGDDIYVVGRGTGDAVIDDAGGDNDTLSFDASVAPADVSVEQSSDGNDLTFTIAGAATRVEIENAWTTGRIENIVFADGTSWSTQDILTNLAASGGGVVIGDGAGNETLGGGQGNAYLSSGGGGDNIYVFNAGDGHDTISGTSLANNDVLVISGYKQNEVVFTRVAADSSDVIVSFTDSSDQILLENEFDSGVASVQLTDDGTVYTVDDIRDAVLAAELTQGDDEIVGTNGGNETIDGGPGNDLIVSGTSNETFLYQQGDGDDRIVLSAPDGHGDGTKVLDLLDYNVSDLASVSRASADSDDLVLTFKTSGDRITLVSALGENNDAYYTFTIQFQDGTVWTRDDMRQQVVNFADTTGNDIVNGAFDSYSWSSGSTGVTFTGQPGNDQLIGGGEGDTFIFAEGDGNDTINESNTNGYGNTAIFTGIDFDRCFGGLGIQGQQHGHPDLPWRHRRQRDDRQRAGHRRQRHPDISVRRWRDLG